ncbi:MAG: queuosine precursor transporter [Pseudomonadota bacterium]
MSTAHAPIPLSRSLFVFSILYGGMTCIAGVLAFKQVALGPLAVEAGIFAFLMLVVISSAMAQLHGQKTANRLVLFGFVPLAVSVVLIALVLSLPPSDKMPPDNLAAFERVLSQTPRIMLAGPLAYGVSLLLNVKIFSALRGATGDGGFGVMIRGAIASALSQTVDTLIFITVAFYGEFPIGSLLLGQMLAKVVLSAIFVPPLIILFVKLARRLDAPSEQPPQ